MESMIDTIEGSKWKPGRIQHRQRMFAGCLRLRVLGAMVWLVRGIVPDYRVDKQAASVDIQIGEGLSVLEIITREKVEQAEKSKRISPSFKRLFDFFLSLVCSVIIIIPMSLLAIIIMLKDPGSPFYFHERVGKDGKSFRLLKLRTMKKDADNLMNSLDAVKREEYLKEYKLRDDPRLIGYRKPGDGKTCFGALLRQYSLDELPQVVWNILIKSDMSFVGPRPVIREELERYYSPEEQALLLSVKPGLTGYWQAYARNNVHYADGERQRMELYYIQNRSFLFDIKILLATVGAVFHKRGW